MQTRGQPWARWMRAVETTLSPDILMSPPSAPRPGYVEAWSVFLCCCPLQSLPAPAQVGLFRAANHDTQLKEPRFSGIEQGPALAPISAPPRCGSASALAS